VSPVSKNRTLAQQLSGAFVVFGALAGVAFVLTAVSYGIGSVWVTPQVERSRQAERAESAAFAAMLDQENGLRGYLMTRDAHFLEAYSRGRDELPRANRALTAAVGAVPELASALLAKRLAEEQWRTNWAEPAGVASSSAATSSMLAGKALFDAYRREQTSLAQALSERSRGLSRREQAVIATRVLLDLAVFIGVLFLAACQHRALRDAIVTPVAALLRHIRGIRDGQLEPTVGHSGPRELAELAQGLNEIVRALDVAQKSAACRDESIRAHSLRLRQILDASREFSESLNLNYVVGAVRESTAVVGGYEDVIVWLMDDEQRRLVNSQDNPALMPAETPADTQHGLAGRAAKSGRITFEGPAGEVRFNDSDSKIKTARAIAIPLIVGARVVGVLEARHVEAEVATREVIETLEMLATHAATAIESARLHEVIEERGQVDALTRLLNRRRLDEDLESECKRCLRYRRPLAFVMLDIDHFKLFNDSHGHPQADTALQAVADVIAGSVRATDTAYRYGGEEFCIVLRETSAEDALHFAERVRQRIEHRFASGAMAGITASFGVAEFSVGSPEPRALVEAADAAMYESKHGGRNRVTLSSKAPVLGHLLS